MRAGHELPQRGAHITSQQPVPESKTVLQPHQGSAGTPRRARQPQRHNPFRNVTWRSDLWENWLDECIASILRGGSSLAYLDSQRCISGRDWDSWSSCLLPALVHIPMHPDSCSQVHAQRRRSTRRLAGDGMYASWYAHLRSQNVPLYPCRLVRC